MENIVSRKDFEDKNNNFVLVLFKGFYGGVAKRKGLIKIDGDWAYMYDSVSSEKYHCAFELTEERLKEYISINLI